MSVENEDLALEIEAVEAILGEAVAVTDIPVPADDRLVWLDNGPNALVLLDAERGEIVRELRFERAYRFSLDMYGEDAVATYSLLEPAEIEGMRSRIQEAYDVLSDPERRRGYDEEKGYAPPDASASAPTCASDAACTSATTSATTSTTSAVADVPASYVCAAAPTASWICPPSC